MGRGDGTRRVVSPVGADDAGTGILHVDMDAFYASVAVLDDPSLRGKAVIIGAPESRSVVSSASYEARRYGVRSAMPVGQALRLCPHAIVVPPHFERYVEMSRRAMAVFHEFTPLVEPLSIDEAFLDVRGAERLWGRPGHIARALRARMVERTGLTCSVGVAATKHVAKMASTQSKPDGLLIVAAADTAAFLAPQPVRALWGVGPQAAQALQDRAIRTVADVLETPRETLERVLGPAMGERVWRLARGIDEREVTTERVEKSIGHEETFATDVADAAFLRSELLRLADRVGRRLRRADLVASGVAIKVRFADFTTVTRSRTLGEPSDVGQRLGEVACELYDALADRRPVRLVGVRAERLSPPGGALALWDDDAPRRSLEHALDAAHDRFGTSAVQRGSLVGRPERQGTMRSHPRPPDPAPST